MKTIFDDSQDFEDDLLVQIDFSELSAVVGDFFGYLQYCHETEEWSYVDVDDLEKYKKAKMFAHMDCTCEAEITPEILERSAVKDVERSAVEDLELFYLQPAKRIRDILFEGFLNVDGLMGMAHNIVEPGYRYAQRWCEPFSRIWHLAEIAKQHEKLCDAKLESERLWAAFFIGRHLSEMRWREHHSEDSLAGKRASEAQTKRTAASGQKSKQRKHQNLECFMQEIEMLASSVGIFTEDRIVAQAYESALEHNPNMPKSKKTREDYETALRSEEPFKSRYEAVFRKNA